LQARFKTSRRIIDAGDFFAVRPDETTVLEPGEVLMEIQLPRPRRGIRSSFLKFSLRNCIDFPIVNCAISIRLENGLVQSAIICLNGVYNVPFRAKKAEQYLVGREITDGTVEAAGELAVFGARPLAQNKYMVFIAADLVKKVLLGCAKNG
jgi:xanthine dehydrogenase YagS FAD-binding subunit